MYKVFLLLSVAFVFTCCTNNNPSTEEAEVTAANVPSQPVKTHYEASHEAPYCKLWVVKHAGVTNDLNNYIGRWFNLKTDNTFESGKWEETNNSGTWSIDEETTIIKMIFKTPETIPSNWKIQGEGGGGRILFKGNVPGNEKGIQVMLEPETVLPVKPSK